MLRLANKIRIARHLAAMVGELQTWTRGEVVEVPSPAIDGRTDIAVVLIPYAEVELDNGATEVIWPGCQIVRNADGDDYDHDASRKLADQLARVIRKLASIPDGSVACYDHDAAEADPGGQWLDAIEVPAAIAELRKLEKSKPATITRRKRKATK